MNRASQAIYQLQLLDNELERVAIEAQTINATLKDDAALRRILQELEIAQLAQRQRERALREAEQELASLAAKIKSHQDRLYNGSITNPRELGTLQQEVQHLRNLHSAQEDRVLEAMDTLEAAQTTLNDATSQRAALEQKRKQEQGALLERQQQVEARLAVLREQRRSQAQQCDAPLLQRYEQLRKLRGGRAVALVEGRACQGCHVTLTASIAQRLRPGTEVITCDNCGRILHLP